MFHCFETYICNFYFDKKYKNIYSTHSAVQLFNLQDLSRRLINLIKFILNDERTRVLEKLIRTFGSKMAGNY